VAVDVDVDAGARVGYVVGTGDEVDEAIRALGVPVTLLDDGDLEAADLSRFTTIVLGVRSFEARRALRAASSRLLRYAEEGGHVVVQYQRRGFNEEGRDSPYAPYPGLAVTSSRVSDETAPIRVLSDDPVLRQPNPIGTRDWEGWVQERGLQFASAQDPRYVDILASTDPFPNNPGEKRGILVVARVGKGTWTYTGLSLFRQLPAGVSGAFRILANLVSRAPGR
jgi:hypothetical protein